jgi:heme/copper-type cytochrome/quinol oxidase subunit 3
VKVIRKVHFFLGTFFAPSIIFFAFTGALQIFGLHEGSGEIAWVARLAEVHKAQTFDAPRKRPPKPAAPAIEAARITAPSPPPAGGPERSGPSRSMMLELFFALMAVSLITSSCLGVYMAFQYKRDRRVIIGLLAAGVVLPVLFLML